DAPDEVIAIAKPMTGGAAAVLTYGMLKNHSSKPLNLSEMLIHFIAGAISEFIADYIFKDSDPISKSALQAFILVAFARPLVQRSEEKISAFFANVFLLMWNYSMLNMAEREREYEINELTPKPDLKDEDEIITETEIIIKNDNHQNRAAFSNVVEIVSASLR